MSAKPINPETVAKIVADWRTGQYSQQALAEKHKVSKGVVNKNTKGMAQDMTAIVTAGVEYRKGLAEHDDRIVTAVTEAVDEKTKDMIFFRKASLIVAQKAVQKAQHPEASMIDLRNAQDIIGKGKENIYGRAPDSAIQINNNVDNSERLSSEEFGAIAEKLLRTI